MFIPVISLIGMEKFLLEDHNNTKKNLLVIPINKTDIFLSKLFVLFIFTKMF
ncbi:ABC transporter permease, partial [Enterococcus faecalis]|uniref:ABC transporter permease n=1 Tax=Enterococcus faecalis TaxID=1351 RepID=UPI003CC5F6F1